MVGNDLVDLQTTRNTTNWERPRFLQKVFTPDEQAIIQSASDPFTTVWTLWSIKESAYKIFLQAGGQPFRAPTKIACLLLANQESEAQIGALRVKASTLITDAYLLTTAQLHRRPLHTKVLPLQATAPQQQSEIIRQALLNDLASMEGLERAALHLQKTALGVPQVCDRHRSLPLSISMTHHGQYGAYSILV